MLEQLVYSFLDHVVGKSVNRKCLIMCDVHYANQILNELKEHINDIVVDIKDYNKYYFTLNGIDIELNVDKYYNGLTITEVIKHIA